MQKQFIGSVALLLFAAGCSSDSGSPAAGNPTNANKKAYVGLFGDQAIAVLDTATQQVLKTIPVTAPDGLVITPDGKKVYVSSTDSGKVVVIDTVDDTLATSVEVGSKPAGLAVTPDGSVVVVSVGGSNEVVLIDTSTDTVTKHVPVPAAHAACITSDGHSAYVASQVTDAPAVVKVDLMGGADPKAFPVDKSPRMLSCTPDKLYFTVVGLDAVEVMDPATGALATPIATGGSPHDVRATPDGKLELVVSQTAGDLELIDPSTGKVAGTVPTGKMAHWITLAAGGASAYVTNEGDNDVVTVDLATLAVTSTIPIGKAPRKMALQP